VNVELELVITREGPRYKIKARSALGEKEGFFELPSLSSKNEILECIDEHRSLDEQFVTEFGIQLFDLLFSDVKGLLHECLDKADHLDIILNMKDTLVSEIPWELCYDPEYKLFLGADPQCSLVRRDHKSTQTFEKIDYPLKVLVIISSPMDLDERDEYQPDPDEIEQLMEPLKKLEEKGMVSLDFLERASVKCIQDALKQEYHIVHFIGHGYYSGEGKGYLIIEDKDRTTKKLEGREVAQLFGTSPPQLMILTACQSAPLIPFLLSKKVPAVMAMQYTVLKDIAHGFVERFYSLLVKGDTITQAVSEARSAVLLEEGITNPGWFTPVLYVRSKEILEINTGSEVILPEKRIEGFNMDTDLIGVENFVGRRNDLWLLEEALFEDNLKVVVVKGIGGIGKTALASKFVKRHKNRFKAVFARKMVDPTMGAEEILALLDQFLVQNGDERLHGVIAEPDLDLKLGGLIHCLKDYLIVLDNFEVLLENGKIADEGVEKFLRAVLSGDHASKVVITTRYGFIFRDQKAGGLVRTVDLDELRLQWAVQLLGKLGVKDFGMQVKIFEKIGGNPQFLEFCAKLAESRRVKELLKDVTPVREKIGEWLLEELLGLLSEEEKNVLKKFSVFRLGVERDAFGVVGASDNIIGRLVYYSLVKFDENYFMHQGVKEYVYSLMSDDERIKAHSEAVKYYRMLLEEKRVNLLDILESHYHLVESEQYEEAGNWVLGLSEPFLRWGYWRKLMELLMQTVKTTDGRTKAGALHNLGAVLESFGNYKEAEKLYRESLDIKKRIGDTAGIASSLHQLGVIQQLQGNYKEAEKLYRESLDIKKRIGDTAGIASSLHQLGMIQQLQGNYKEAEKLYRESLDILKSIGDTAGIASSLHQLGMIQQLQGNYKEAEKLYRESLDILKKIGDTAGIATSLHQLGVIQELQGNYKEAEKLYRESLDILKRIGDTAGIASSLHQLGVIQQLQGNYKEAEKLYRESLDIKKKIGDTAGIATSLGQLGRINEKRKNYEEAVKYYATSLSIFLRLNSPYAETAIKDLQRVKETIGEEQFDHYWKTITNQEVPDYIKSPFEELEDYIQYIINLRKNGEQEEIIQATEKINQLLKEDINPDAHQFFHLLLDYLSGEDISQRIQELEEPFKSILEKHMK